MLLVTISAKFDCEYRCSGKTPRKMSSFNGIASREAFLRLKTELYWWNRELTLKCKLKCYVKPKKDPLGVSTSKGNQGTTRGKEKIFLTSGGIERTTS